MGHNVRVNLREREAFVRPYMINNTYLGTYFLLSDIDETKLMSSFGVLEVFVGVYVKI